ncbi:alpha/beta hydrolase [Pleomorphochaeta sp. DL1XJH-081]|jgi:enterochelin esterase-like enzyme|uniref:alpha/beta hydrolase n=2 Tax=Sphaerochaetaceae TaxID=2791015 RepID=UPI003BB50866
MRMHAIAMLVLLSIGLLGSCGSFSASTTVDALSHTNQPERELEASYTMEGDNDSDNPIPKELWTIPNEYLREADQPGTLVELRYDTYESRTYAQKSKPITKRAIVYLPYEYSDEKEYNVLYLMHGGWSNETTTLGTPEQPSAFKHVVDHGIRNGEFDPLIIVCPTYNNESPEDSADYTLAFYTLTANYHQELVNDLIPAVEGTYSTYAKGTSAEDIRESRDYRAFGGFSMGSVATWHTFINSLDAFRYFLPMSGAMDYDGDIIDAAVTASDFIPDDYFIYAITGSSDFAYGQFARQIEAMIAKPSGNFKLYDDERSGNIAYRVKEGYSHDGRAAMEYTYNGLRWFWN